MYTEILELYREEIQIRETQLKRVLDLFDKNSAQESEVEEFRLKLIKSKREYINAQRN